MNRHELGARLVCHSCVQEELIVRRIVEMARIESCFYCGEQRTCGEISAIASGLDEILEDHFECQESVPSIYGEDYHDYIAMDDVYKTVEGIYKAGDIAIAVDIVNFCRPPAAYIAASSGGFDPYAEEVRYRLSKVSNPARSREWQSFIKVLRENQRFINPRAEEMLDDLFCDIDQVLDDEGRPIVYSLYFGVDNPLFRGRLALSYQKAEAILSDAVNELGAPASSYAKAGRMNAPGVAVFYGSTDFETCVAEVRAPVGSKVVIGKFVTCREVRVIDFERMRSTLAEVSHFDPEYLEKTGRLDFFSVLSEFVSRPVVTEDIEREYLPTQFLAEYLAQRLRLDGLVFNSSQNNGAGRNVVLFNHACHSATNVQGKVINIFWDYEGLFGDKPGVLIAEETRQTESTTAGLPWPVPVPVSPVVSLLKDGIQVVSVEAVKYEVSSLPVRFENADPSSSKPEDFQ